MSSWWVRPCRDINDTPVGPLWSMHRNVDFIGHQNKKARISPRLFISALLQRRAFGSLIPPLGLSGPDAARELRFIRSSVAVPVEMLRVSGAVVLEEAYVSRTTVRSRPRKSEKMSNSTTTATTTIPRVPPGKLRVVVVVTSVAVPRVTVALVVAASVVVGCVAWSVAVPVGAGVVCVLTLPVPGVAVGVLGF
jgi:hypothetical protein